MRLTSSSIIFAFGAATTLPAQTDSTRELEHRCTRMVDDPRPANLQAMQPAIDAESGARASFMAGCRFLAEQEWGAAGKEFEKAVRAEPDVAIYHFWFGRATGEQVRRVNKLRQPGLASRVKGEFEKAAALDSTYIAPHEGLLYYYLGAPGFLGGVNRARMEADKITAMDAFRGGLAHAHIALATKDTVGFVRAHEGLLAQFPDSATSYLALLNVHVVRKRWSAAWTVVDRLEQVRPGLSTVRYAVGRLASESGQQLERGETALRSYLQYEPLPNEPSLAAAHWRLGQIAEQRGDVGTARLAYGTASSIDPKFKQAREALARVK